MNNLNEQFKKEIEQLKQAGFNMEPNPLFIESSKERLLSKIAETPVTKPTRGRIFDWKNKKLKRLTATGTLLTLLFFITTSGASAAYTSLPGDLLYSVRQGLENAQVALEKNPQEKALRRFEQAEDRLIAASLLENKEIIARLVDDASIALQEGVDQFGGTGLEESYQTFVKTQEYSKKAEIISDMISRAIVKRVESTEIKSGLTPKDPLYFADTVSENIELFFTLSPAKKARKRLEIAQEKLAEADELSEEKYSQKALERYQKHLNKISKIIDKQPEKIKERIALRMAALLDRDSTLLNEIKENSQTELHNKVDEIEKESNEHYDDAITIIQYLNETKAESTIEKHIEEREDDISEIIEEKPERAKKIIERIKKHQDLLDKLENQRKSKKKIRQETKEDQNENLENTKKDEDNDFHPKGLNQENKDIKDRSLLIKETKEETNTDELSTALQE